IHAPVEAKVSAENNTRPAERLESVCRNFERKILAESLDHVPVPAAHQCHQGNMRLPITGIAARSGGKIRRWGLHHELIIHAVLGNGKVKGRGLTGEIVGEGPLRKRREHWGLVWEHGTAGNRRKGKITAAG